MHSLWQIIKSHSVYTFQWKAYSLHLVLLTILIYINYQFNIENDILDKIYPTELRSALYFLEYAVGFYTSCFILTLSGKLKDIWSSPVFYQYSLAGLFILTLHSSFPYLNTIVNWFRPNMQVYFWFYWIANNIQKFATVAIPLAIMYWLTKKHSSSSFYGLASFRFNAKPFLLLLLILVPLVYVATLDQSFIDYYPTYRPNAAAHFLHWPEWTTMIIYELTYSLDFISVELLFRGFFVIGLYFILGKEAILPMITLYCMLHFGKPLGETISSAMGGYLLGVIAMYTRSIWGGIMLHVGLAWMMDLAAYLVKS